MPTRKQARLADICDYVAERSLPSIGEDDFEELLRRFAPISERALRKTLRETGIPLSAVVEGIRQDDLDQLERTLTAFTAEYQGATRDRARRLRRMVITAKEHARFAAARSKNEAQQKVKAEMAEWILVWLENPAIFPQWVRLRRGLSNAVIRPD